MLRRIVKVRSVDGGRTVVITLPREFLKASLIRRGDPVLLTLAGPDLITVDRRVNVQEGTD